MRKAGTSMARRWSCRQSLAAETGPSSLLPGHGTERRSAWLRYAPHVAPYALIAAVLIVVYGQVCHYEFLTWDDDKHITQNPYLNPVSPDHVARFWKRPYEGLYVPVSYTFFAAEAALSRSLLHDSGPELDPAVFHVVSLLLHVLCTVLVFRLLERAVNHRRAACCGALFFGLHPMQVESVAWVSETRGLLAALCGLVALLAYQRFRDAGAGEAADQSRRVVRRRQAGHYGAATAAFLLALLAKPSAVAIPLLAGILDYALPGRSMRRIIQALGGWLLLAAAVIVTTKLQQPTGEATLAGSAWQRFFIGADALAFYLFKLFVPWPLTFDYGRRPEAVVQSFWLYAAWLVPLGAALLVTLVDRFKDWRVPLAVFLAALLPVLGFVPFSFQDISTVADRYVYLALLGPALGISVVLARRWSKRAVVVTALLLAACGSMSSLQAGYWKDSRTLYRHALQVNTQSFVAHNNLGNLLLKRGQLSRAYEHFRKAVLIKSDYPEANYNFGLVLARRGELGRAAHYLRRSLRENPDYAEAHYDLAVVLERLGRPEQALDHYQTAVRLRPGYAAARNNLGNALRRMGRLDEAVAQYQAALQSAPQLLDARVNLGHARLMRGESAQAMDHYQRALAIDPGHEAARLNLGLLHLEQGRPAEARRHFRRLLRNKPGHVQARFHLARAQHKLGNDGEARRNLEKALQLVPEASEPARRIQEMLDELKSTEHAPARAGREEDAPHE